MGHLTEYLMIGMEWIGTVAFAVSGALIAISHSFDLFGVVIVGCTTAVGGGIVRDLLLGRIPPQIFSAPLILLLAIVTALAVFVIAAINSKKFAGLSKRIEKINIYFDAIGLAAFSVAGVEAAATTPYGSNALLAITVGLITGVGGGVMRDVFVNEKPYILTKHIYAVASLAGCVVYWLVGIFWEQKVIATVAAMGLIIVTRMLAFRYRWKLPKIELDEGTNV